MAKEYVRHVGEQAVQQLPLEQMQLFAAAQLNKGMITIMDPADIELGALTLSKNARVRYDKTSRRNGYSLLSPAAPNGNKILRLIHFKSIAGQELLFRITRNSIHYTDLSAWTPVTATNLIGGDNDRIWAAVGYDTVPQDYRIYFCNNGKNKIQQIRLTGGGSPLCEDIDTGSASAIAPKTKFVTVFSRRVIGAMDPNTALGPISLFWSGDGAFREFDPAIDVSAGQTILQESPGDRSDFITGVLAFTNVMVIPRERSIWLATSTQDGSNPFYFYGAVPGIGCNAPYSIAVVPHGLCFVDTLTGSVWAYSYSYNYGYVAGSNAPERIGLPIEKDLIANISDPSQIFGSYSDLNNEYSVCIPITGTNVVRVWTFNFKNKTWSYMEKLNISEMADLGNITAITSIGGLIGLISQLMGNINQLSTTKTTSSTQLFGMADGTIQQDDSTTDTDADGDYTMDIQSKDFVFPYIDTYTSEIRIEYIAHIAGAMTLKYHKWGDPRSESTWVTAKTFTPTKLEEPQLLRFRKNIKARRIRWRLVATKGTFDILSYEVHVYPGGESRSSR